MGWRPENRPATRDTRAASGAGPGVSEQRACRDSGDAPAQFMVTVIWPSIQVMVPPLNVLCLPPGMSTSSEVG